MARFATRCLPLALGLLAACGYRFAARGGGLPSGVEAVDVPVFQNQTTEAGLEGQLTDEIRHRLAQLGYAGSSPESATLVGTIVVAGGGPIAPKVAFTDAGAGVGYAPALYLVSLTVSAKLLRGGELLWQGDNITLSERYLPSDDLATFEANRRQALHRLIRDLGREIVIRLTSGL